MHFAELVEAEASDYQIVLSSETLYQCQVYYNLLKRWGRVVNLTAISDPLKLARYHFLESLFGARFVLPTHRLHHDLGSGAGFPAIPLKLLCPNLHSALFDSKQRRGAFLKELVRELHLANVSIHNCRIDSLQISQWTSFPDFITFRGVSFSDEVLDEIISHLSSGGRLLIWHGASFSFSASVWNTRKLSCLVRWLFPHSRARYLSVFERC